MINPLEVPAWIAPPATRVSERGEHPSIKREADRYWVRLRKMVQAGASLRNVRPPSGSH